MSRGLCPNCDTVVNVGNNPAVGHEITCKSCLITSVIVWLNPVELEVIDYDEEYEDDSYDEYLEELHPEV